MYLYLTKQRFYKMKKEEYNSRIRLDEKNELEFVSKVMISSTGGKK